MKELEYIELTKAEISKNYAGAAIAGKGGRGGDASSVLEPFLIALQSRKIPAEEVIVVSPNGNEEIFVSFERVYVEKIAAYLSNSDQANNISIQDDLLQVKIMGTGFARSHEFVEKIYNTLYMHNVNMRAQMCSDLEILIYCKVGEAESEIVNALGDLGLRIEMD